MHCQASLSCSTSRSGPSGFPRLLACGQTRLLIRHSCPSLLSFWCLHPLQKLDAAAEVRMFASSQPSSRCRCKCVCLCGILHRFIGSLPQDGPMHAVLMSCSSSAQTRAGPFRLAVMKLMTKRCSIRAVTHQLVRMQRVLLKARQLSHMTTCLGLEMMRRAGHRVSRLPCCMPTARSAPPRMTRALMCCL